MEAAVARCRESAAENERSGLFLSPEEDIQTAAESAAVVADIATAAVTAATATTNAANVEAARAAAKTETESERLSRLRFECEIVGDLQGAILYHKQLLLLPPAEAAAAAVAGPAAAAEPSEAQLYVQLAALLLRANPDNKEEAEQAMREAVDKFGGLHQVG